VKTYTTIIYNHDIKWSKTLLINIITAFLTAMPAKIAWGVIVMMMMKEGNNAMQIVEVSN